MGSCGVVVFEMFILQISPLTFELSPSTFEISTTFEQLTQLRPVAPNGALKH